MKKFYLICLILIIFHVFISFCFAGDFSDIQNEIDDDVNIQLTDNTYKVDTTKSIIVNKDNVVIKGKSTKSVLDASGSDDYIMRINGDNIRLENLIFKNGNTKDERKGGAINIYSRNVTVVNCEFVGNKGQVGAIYISNAANNVEINNCIFKENNACYESSSGGKYGGAINSHCGSCKITDCEFISNKAHGGGAINIYDGGCTIDSCVFENNYASLSGGAIWMSTIATDDVNIINSNFTGNHAENNGGAIYILSSTICSVYNCEFSNNYADSGAAIYNKNKLFVTGSAFLNNKASSKLSSGLVSSKNYVNCSDDAVINVILEGGNNIIDAIWSDNPIIIDDASVNPNNKIPSQNIILNINGLTFISTTDSNGVATFKFNTKGFKVQIYTYTVSFEGSTNYFRSSGDYNLKIATKVVYHHKIKNKKLIKTRKVYQIYATKYYYNNVKYHIDYYMQLKLSNGNTKGYFFDSEEGYKNVKFSKKIWKTVSKKDLDSKYKWYKSKFYKKYHYKCIKYTYKYVNGVFIKKFIKKNHKYTKKSKMYNYRKIDWSNYVLPSYDCESDNSKIHKKVKQIIKVEAKRLHIKTSKLTDEQKASAILKWVQLNIKYDNYGNTRNGALKTLKLKTGNCVDASHLAIALLRATNIPAKYEAKFLDYAGEGHCWHLSYFVKKWHVGESTHQTFFVKYDKLKNWHNAAKKYSGIYLNSYNYVSKMVEYKGYWCDIEEYHFINNNWECYYFFYFNGISLKDNNLNNKEFS